MNNRGWIRRRPLLLGSALLTSVIAGLFVMWPFGSRQRADHDYRGVPLVGIASLRGVTEPISIVKGSATAGSDDHWMGLTFQGSDRVEREAKFIYYWPPWGNHPEYRKALLLGEGVRASVSEERAFLGLLQRWYRGDEEAPKLRDRVERRDPSLGRTPFGWDGLTNQQAGKVVAISLMKVLEGRN